MVEFLNDDSRITVTIDKDIEFNSYKFFAEVVVPLMRMITYDENVIMSGMDEYLEANGWYNENSNN